MNIHNIGNWPSRNALLHPAKVALRHGDQTLTWRAFANRTQGLANAMLALGLHPGDRVALLLRNSIPYLELVFACSQVGLILVPLNWRLVPEELAFILKDSGARALVWEPALAASVKALEGNAPSLQIVVGDAVEGTLGYEDLLAGGSSREPAEAASVTADTPHLIMYTAGTTGRPKGVVLSHGNTSWQCINALHLGILPDVVALAILPFFHVGGLHGSALAVLHIGGTLVILDRFDPGEVLRTIAKERIHGMVGVPAMFLFMSQHPDFETTDLSSVVALTSGGAPLPVPLIRTYERRGVLFRQGYGLTECSAGVTGMDPADAYRKTGSAGKACFYTEVAIVSEQGAELPAGEAGEVVVRGPNVMQGYWGLPEVTAETLKGGWLHTGDIGRMDEEGYLYLVDRKKEMIISGGENIFPAEIENVIFALPAVAECAVLGVPDDKFGERPVAVVVPRAGELLDAAAVLSFLDGRLARFKLPRQILIRQTALPRNAAGKVLKPALREEVLALSDT